MQRPDFIAKVNFRDENKMIKKLRFTFLIIIPVLFLIFGYQFERTKYSTDPESAYLMNGLNIATFKAVGHFDNPGTTVQMYSAIVVKVVHKLRSNSTDLQTDVIQNSEFYIEVLRKGLIIFNALIILLLGLVALILLDNLWFGLILQIAPFLSVTLIEECFTKVAPEPVLFSTVVVLIILLLKYYNNTEPKDRKYSLLFALLAGFGLATKMTFLPLIIIPFVVLQGRKNKLIYLGAIIPAFILFTLPAVQGYAHMAYWFLNLGTHTGTYGQGNSGIIDPVVYFNSIIAIAVNNKTFVVVMLLAAILIITVAIVVGKLKLKENHKEFSILLSIILAQAGSMILVAKHYHSNHYLFPALSLIGIVLVFSYLFVNKNLQEKSRKYLRISLPVIFTVVLGLSLLNIPDLTQAYNGYRASNQSTDEAFTKLDRDYKDYVKVFYYPGSFNVYSSLRWGNIYSRQYSTDKLLEIYPEGLFYNYWDKSFQLWETNISARRFIKNYGNKILLVGGPKTSGDFKTIEQQGLKLNKLFENRLQVVYQIDVENSDFFKGVTIDSLPVWSLQANLESISPDGKWILSQDGTQFSLNSALSSGNARSGKNAFSLPVFDSYAMEYKLTGVKPGDAFEISSWCSSGGKEAFLVASAGASDPFYQQSNGFVETDPKGWKNITLDLKIPDNFKGDKIKIYFWNHGNTPVWFDDIEIDKYR